MEDRLISPRVLALEWSTFRGSIASNLCGFGPLEISRSIARRGAVLVYLNARQM